MIKFIQLVVLAFTLLGCSNLTSEQSNYLRDPASQSLTVDDVLSFKTGSKTYSEDLTKKFQGYINNVYGEMPLKYVIIEDRAMPKDVSIKLEFAIVNDIYTVNIRHAPNAFYDHEAVIGATSFISKVSNYSKYFKTPYSFFEIYYNARESDPIALDNLLKMRNTFTKTNALLSEISPEELFEQVKNDGEKMQEELAPAVKKALKDRRQATAARKAIIDALDKVSDDQQFKALIAMNDRAGVAELLRKYLPFEDMAPFEKRFWESYLEVIKHPVPVEQRIIAYRGIQDDFIHRAIVAGKEVDKDVAIRDGKAFLMSTMLVKNQGSWNRRLRSLQTMEEKFIGTVDGKSEFAQSARITTMFKNHSKKAEGSPFLSFTPDTKVAKQFGAERSAVFLVDPRLQQFNYTSDFKIEKEFLIGLMTFPDEMVGIWSTQFNKDEEATIFYERKLNEYVEQKFGKAQKDAILNKIKKNSANFYAPIYAFEGVKAEEKSTSNLSNLSDFFKNFIGGNKAEPTPHIDVKGNLSCEDIIKTFWVK